MFIFNILYLCVLDVNVMDIIEILGGVSNVATIALPKSTIEGYVTHLMTLCTHLCISRSGNQFGC